MTTASRWAAAATVATLVLVPSFVRAAGAPTMGQLGSDRRLAAQLPVVDRAIDMLQRANTDYRGYRVQAIGQLKTAESDLRSALRHDNENEPTPFPVPYTPPEGGGGNNNTPQTRSDEILIDARTLIERSIDQLQRDSHDYGGYRARAVTDLQSARDSLNTALAGSDRNIVATAGLLDHAVDVLNGANEDYQGHRVKAIEAIDQSRKDLRTAMKIDNVVEGATMGRIASDWESPGGNPEMPQAASDERLRDARAMVENAIDQLQRDEHDYHGYRALAVTSLYTARRELDQALATK